MERTLKAVLREVNGKGGARKVRASGKVPGVVYGHGMEPVPVSIDALELYHVLHTQAGTNVLIDLQVGKDSHLAMPREIQQDLIRGRFIHVDFLAVRRDETITVDVPITLVGESHGVKEGGVIEHHLWDLKVECLPTNVPEHIEADISALGIGDALRVADVRVPEGVEIQIEPEETIVSVVPPPILEVEAEVEEAAEGEVPEGEEEAAAEGEGATTEEAQEHAEQGEGGGEEG